MNKYLLEILETLHSFSLKHHLQISFSPFICLLFQKKKKKLGRERVKFQANSFPNEDLFQVNSHQGSVPTCLAILPYGTRMSTQIDL